MLAAISRNLIRDFTDEYNYWDYTDFGVSNKTEESLDELTKYLTSLIPLKKDYVKNPYAYWDNSGSNLFPRLAKFSDKALVLKSHECDIEGLFSLNKALVGVDKGNLGIGKGTAMLRINSYAKSGINLCKYDPYDQEEQKGDE